MKRWPPYSGCRDSLTTELASDMDLAHMPVKELVNTAARLRDQYWEAGGDFSPFAYVHIYKARRLLELACERDANDLGAIDELIETIQAACQISSFDEAGQKVRNKELDDLMLEWRGRQFAQVSREVEAGRPPCADDFVRLADLAMVLSIYDIPKARQVVGWLRQQASPGGWDGYGNMLARFQEVLDRDEAFAFNVYRFAAGSPSDGPRYNRRYPSFRGPHPEKRGLYLWGMRRGQR